MPHKYLLLMILMSQLAFSKIEINKLKGIDILKDHPHLNPGHGVAFTESGLLENIGELSVETTDYKEPDYLNQARDLINSLFYRIASGFLPSSGANKVSFYLHPELIGTLLKKTIDLPKKKIGDNSQESLKNELIELILSDEKVKEKLELSRVQYCNFDAEIKKIEKETKAPYSEEVIEQLNKLKRSRRFNQVFKKPKNHACQGLEVKKDEKIDYKNLTLKSNLNAIGSALSYGKNLLVTRTMLALLWHKAEKKDDFASYLKQIEGKEVKLIEEEWKKDDFKKELDFKEPALMYFYSFYVGSKKIKINLFKQGYSYISKKGSKITSFPDCGATSLRNFIRLWSFDGNKYDIGKLEEIGASKEVVNYFEKYSTHDLQASQEARNKWGAITCNKNVDNPDTVYLTRMDHNKCEINAGEHNMLKIMNATLFADAKNKAQNWDDINKKLKQQNPNLKLLMDKSKIKNNLGHIDFEVDEHMHKYRWNFLSHHFYIEEIGATNNNNETKFNKIMKKKSEHLNNLGNINISSELSWFEYMGLLNFTNKNTKIIALEKLPNERMFLLNTNSDENIIDIVNTLKNSQTGLIKTLVHKIRNNDDTFKRLILKTTNDTEKLNYIFSTSKNKSINIRERVEDKTFVTKLAEAIKKNDSITMLSIEHNELGDEPYIKLSKTLEDNKTITNLNLSWNNLKEKAGIQLAKVLENNNTLTNLNLSINLFGEKTGTQLAKALENNNTLTNLNLGINKFGEKTGTQLAKALENNKTLTTLYLNGNNFGEKTDIQLAKALESNNTLTNLYLGVNKFGEKTDIQLAKALESNNTLTNLEINNNKLEENDGIQLAKALEKNKTLTYLDINENDIGENAGIQLAKALEKNKTLTTLYSSGNNLGENAGIQLAKALEKNKTLTSLYLSENNLGENTGIQLAKALEKNKTLTTLYLNRNNLGENAGIQLAKALEKNKTLTYLGLNRNNLGEKTGIQLVKALEKNKTLTYLAIEYNYLGNEVKERLNQIAAERDNLEIDI